MIDNVRACRHMLGAKSLHSFHWLGAFYAAFMFVQPCHGAPGHFENTANLATARDRHTATVLPNGKVLVAGGHGDLNTVATAELFDPVSKTWTATGNLVERRYSHSATLLPNGKVLAAGGYPTEFVSTASFELYDPSTGTWTLTSSDVNFPGGGNHTATLLPSGKVLVAGGAYLNVIPSSYASLDWAELYDADTGTWTQTGRLLQRRDSHTATLLPDGTVLVAGGHCFCYAFNCPCENDPGVSAELYHPVSGIWTATSNLGTSRYAHTATLLGNGKVLVVGGGGPGNRLATAELYDPTSGTWSPTGSLAVPRSNHTATLLPSGNVLVTGGLGNPNSPLASAELYNFRTGTWTPTGSLGTPNTYQTATLITGGNVLIAGGTASITFPLASAELYITQPLLLNISTRLNVQIGDDAMIGGFIITGAEPKTVIVRGLGPSLGIPGALADPAIEVHGAGGELLASNDNWRDAPNSAQVAASLPPSSDLESALWGIINPGVYTVIVRGNNNATGIGLFEVYDLDENANCQLANISTRGLVATGNDVLIGGVIVASGSGGTNAKVLFRALGPSVPVAGALVNPTLELHDGSGMLIDSNDNWKVRPDGSSQQAEIEATGIPPTNDLESALLGTLPPGNYTAILRGNGGEIGIGLVEAYNLP